MVARLKPGATVAEAQSQIDAQNATLEVDDPQAKMIADAGFRSLVVLCTRTTSQQSAPHYSAGSGRTVLL